LSYTIDLRQENMYFLFNITKFHFFVTYVNGAVYVHFCLFEMFVEVLATCHIQYTRDTSICVFI